VSGVRASADADRTRLVFDLDGPVEFNIFSLVEPWRVVLDLPEVRWNADPGLGSRTVGVVSGIRYGLFRPGNSRVVLDLTAPARVVDARVLPPTSGRRHRLQVDLAPTDPGSFAAGLQAPTRVAAMTPAAAVAEPLKRDRRRVVVIDPGHGGVDPGAIANSGTYEKDLVLSYALELKRRLERHGGFRVVMTRDRDMFLSLRERVEVARRTAADLFVSLHADSIDNARMRGGAIYTLSETASDKEAAALAARENKADVIAGVALDGQDEDVTTILIDLAQRDTMNRSALLANGIVDRLSGQRVLLRNRPHRFAGFRVLKAPDVPSVLVELGYLSNDADEKYLRSARGRAAIADGLVQAILAYFADHKG